MISQSGGRQPRWRRDGKELFFVGIAGQLLAASVAASGGAFQAGVPKPLFESGVAGGAGWDVSPDGMRFLFPTARHQAAAQAPFTMVLNWQAALKK